MGSFAPKIKIAEIPRTEIPKDFVRPDFAPDLIRVNPQQNFPTADRPHQTIAPLEPKMKIIPDLHLNLGVRFVDIGTATGKNNSPFDPPSEERSTTPKNLLNGPLSPSEESTFIDECLESLSKMAEMLTKFLRQHLPSASGKNENARTSGKGNFDFHQLLLDLSQKTGWSLHFIWARSQGLYLPRRVNEDGQWGYPMPDWLQGPNRTAVLAKIREQFWPGEKRSLQEIPAEDQPLIRFLMEINEVEILYNYFATYPHIVQSNEGRDLLEFLSNRKEQFNSQNLTMIFLIEKALNFIGPDSDWRWVKAKYKWGGAEYDRYGFYLPLLQVLENSLGDPYLTREDRLEIADLYFMMGNDTKALQILETLKGDPDFEPEAAALMDQYQPRWDRFIPRPTTFTEGPYR